MLAIPLVLSLMTQKSLSVDDIALHCGVSDDNVSRWLAGDSLPRPAKLKTLATLLGTDMQTLCGIVERRGEVFPSTQEEQDIAAGLRTLAPLMQLSRQSSKAQLRFPCLEPHYIADVAQGVLSSAKLDSQRHLTAEQLVQLHRSYGVNLAPVRQLETESANAVLVYLKEQEASVLVFNANAPESVLMPELARTLGFALCRQGFEADAEAAATFAQAFGKALLGAFAPVVGQDEAVPAFPDLQGLNGSIFVERAEQLYRSPVFEAISRWQRQEGGRSPAFIKSTLGVGLYEAMNLSLALW